MKPEKPTDRKTALTEVIIQFSKERLGKEDCALLAEIIDKLVEGDLDNPKIHDKILEQVMAWGMGYMAGMYSTPDLSRSDIDKAFIKMKKDLKKELEMVAIENKIPEGYERVKCKKCGSRNLNGGWMRVCADCGEQNA